MQRRPVYVRLPEPAADKLDRVAFERKVSKQDLVADLVSNHLDTTVAPPRVALELADDGLTVGRHAFRPAPAPAAEVLTVPELAELLRSTEDAVLELAESGELPGRRLGGEWRFARAAVLEWLGRPEP